MRKLLISAVAILLAAGCHNPANNTNLQLRESRFTASGVMVDWNHAHQGVGGTGGVVAQVELLDDTNVISGNLCVIYQDGDEGGVEECTGLFTPSQLPMGSLWVLVGGTDLVAQDARLTVNYRVLVSGSWQNRTAVCRQIDGAANTNGCPAVWPIWED